MMGPHRSEVEPVAVPGMDPALMRVYRVRHFDCTLLNNAAMVPTAGYSVGSLQVVDIENKTSLSTGVIKASVSNDPACDVVVAHPTTTSLSAAGATAGVALEHAYFGAQVTTIQGSAGDETVKVELWICLKA